MCIACIACALFESVSAWTTASLTLIDVLESPHIRITQRRGRQVRTVLAALVALVALVSQVALVALYDEPQEVLEHLRHFRAGGVVLRVEVVAAAVYHARLR